VLSLTPGSWFSAASNAVLHASLRSAFLSLRQVVIASGSGMNALQSLSASGVHAVRCASVPCEKEGVGETVADNRTSNTHHRAKGIGRTIQSTWLSMFIIGLSYPQSESTLDIVVRQNRNTLVPAFVLVAKRQRLELSIPSAVLLFRADMRGPGFIGFANIGCAQTSKSSHVCPSVGNNTNANVPAGIVLG
jgi:hypothetical protein